MLLLASLFAAHLAPRAAAERPFPDTPAVVTSAELSSSAAPVTSTSSLVTHVRRQLLFERYSCGRSRLKGYTSSKRLAPGGKMDGSNAVAMEDTNNPPAVYDLEGTSAANAASWTVGSPSISSAGGKVTMKFTKNKGDGASVKVNANGNNNIVWAYGDGTAVSTHTDRGNVVVNFACGCPLFRNC
ncbi:unnamed protein product [Closterium sp. Yama58-4]|nr:unnamed protein product [Closterium sp. Yama58-4]